MEPIRHSGSGGDAVPVTDITVPKWRVPVDTAHVDYRALKSSVRASGVREALLLRRTPEGGLEVVHGARRLQAACDIGQETVPAIVRDLDEVEAIITAWDAVRRDPVSSALIVDLERRLTAGGVASDKVASLLAALAPVEAPAQESPQPDASPAPEADAGDPAMPAEESGPADAAPAPAADTPAPEAPVVDEPPGGELPTADAGTAAEIKKPPKANAAGKPARSGRSSRAQTGAQDRPAARGRRVPPAAEPPATTPEPGLDAPTPGGTATAVDVEEPSTVAPPPATAEVRVIPPPPATAGPSPWSQFRPKRVPAAPPVPRPPTPTPWSPWRPELPVSGSAPETPSSTASTGFAAVDEPAPEQSSVSTPPADRAAETVPDVANPPITAPEPSPWARGSHGPTDTPRAPETSDARAQVFPTWPLESTETPEPPPAPPWKAAASAAVAVDADAVVKAPTAGLGALRTAPPSPAVAPPTSSRSASGFQPSRRKDRDRPGRTAVVDTPHVVSAPARREAPPEAAAPRSRPVGPAPFATSPAAAEPRGGPRLTAVETFVVAFDEKRPVEIHLPSRAVVLTSTLGAVGLLAGLLYLVVVLFFKSGGSQFIQPVIVIIVSLFIATISILIASRHR